MSKLFTFGGITTANIKEGFLEENFECIQDDDIEIVYLSKKKYEHREEGLNFDYKYIVSALDMTEFDEEPNEDNTYCIEVYLVVSPECLHEKVKNDIEYSTNGYCDYLDVVQYGLGIIMLHDSKPYSEKEVDEVMNNVSCLVEHIDRMRGFHLDRHVNKVGNTGWDLIDNCLDGVSFIDRWIEKNIE